MKDDAVFDLKEAEEFKSGMNILISPHGYS